MKKLYVLVLLLTCFVSAARADDSLEKIDLAKKISSLQIPSDVRKRTDTSLAMMLTPLVVRDNPGQEEKINQIMQQTVVASMDANVNEMIEQNAERYAAGFSLDELEKIYDFQSSPVGQKMVQFNRDNATKAMNTAKTQGPLKAQEAMHNLALQLRASGLQVPKEIDR